MAWRPADVSTAALLAAVLLAGCGDQSAMTLAPISTGGSVQTTVLTRRATDGSVEHTVQQSGTIGADSYIWYPWFARVSGDVTLAYDRTAGDEDSSSFRASGSGQLAVLPRSKYPVTVDVAHLDSRASGDFATGDYVRDRAAVTARAAITQNLNGGIVASWDRSDRDDSGVLNSQNVSLDLNQTFAREDAFLGINSVGVGVGLRNSSFDADDPEDNSARKLGVVRFNLLSEPLDNLTYNTLVTATYDDLEEENDAYTRYALQGVSTAQWRPDDKPYIVTGTLRTLTEKIDETNNGAPSNSETILADTTVGLRWPVSDRLSFSAGLRGSYENIQRDSGASLGESDLEDGERIVGLVLLGADYNSEPRERWGFDWSWIARGQADNGFRSDEGAVSRETITLGHRLERDYPELIFVPIRFAFDQELELNADTEEDDLFGIGIAHSFTFDYAKADEASSTFARLYLRDSRTVIGDRREFNIAQATFGRSVSVDRDRRWQGNVTAQAIREVDDDGSNLFGTASGNISYLHRNLFEVDDLSFRSELRLNIVNLDDFFGSTEDELANERFRNDWRNILSYRIGRLTAELEGSAYQRDTGLGYLALMRVRRDFGGDQ